MSSKVPYLLDVSNTSGANKNISDFAAPPGFGKTGALEQARVFSANHCGLVSLVATLSCPLYDAVRCVTTLNATNNKIISLNGIEAFVSLEVLNLRHNKIGVVDAHASALLRRLSSLRVIDLSHNGLRLLDLDGLQSSQRPNGSFLGEELSVLNVTLLDLSHNALVELPDLRCMPALQILNLDNNSIEDIADLDNKLPLVSLTTLQLRRNRLLFSASLVPLTALAESLEHLQLYGNPFTLKQDAGTTTKQPPSAPVAHRSGRGLVPGVGVGAAISPTDEHARSAAAAGEARKKNIKQQPDESSGDFSWRPLVLWLLPHLCTLDLVDFTQSEKDAAAHLFRERGALSRDLIEMLNPQHREELPEYLRRQCDDVRPPADMMDIIQATEEADNTEAAEGYATTAAAMPMKPIQAAAEGMSAGRGGVRGKLPVEDTSYTATNASTMWTDPIEGPRFVSPFPAAPNSPQQNFQCGGVSSSSNNANVVAVVRALQGKLKSLSSIVEALWKEDMVRRHFAAIVIQRYFRGAQARRKLAEREPAYRELPHIALTRSIAPSTSPSSPMAITTGSNGASLEMQEVLESMRSLKKVITTMWGDLDEFRRMSDREQSGAALTIQRYYRGYMARKEWHGLKESYDEFVSSLCPFVVLLQSVGRGYVVRRELCKSHEVHSLRLEVKDLRDEVAELRALVHRSLGMSPEAAKPPSQQRHTDPGEAMDDIIDNFAKGNRARSTGSSGGSGGGRVVATKAHLPKKEDFQQQNPAAATGNPFEPTENGSAISPGEGSKSLSQGPHDRHLRPDIYIKQPSHISQRKQSSHSCGSDKPATFDPEEL